MAAYALRMGSRLGVFGVIARLAGACGLAATLSGCLGYDGVVVRGAVVDTRRISEVKPGMPAPQVLSVIGTPSTTSTVGGEAWYYVSQRAERTLAFMPQSVTDQHVFAVYFDKSKRVQRVADYSLADGKPVDFETRITPNAGTESNLVAGLLSKVPGVEFK